MDNSAQRIDAYLAGDLTEEQARQLQSWLEQDPSHIDQFVEACLLESQMAEIVGQRQLQKHVAKLGQPTAMPTPAISHTGAPRGKAASGWRGLARDLSREPWALAILLLVMIFGGALIWQLTKLPPGEVAPNQTVGGGRKPLVLPAPATAQGQPTMIARLIRGVNASWQPSKPLANGAALVAGQRLSLQAGLAEIAFNTGATVMLEGPAELELGAKGAGIGSQESGVGGQVKERNPHPMVNACSLSKGKLVARVPSSAHGFTVTTPTLQIVDLGTEFAVRVQPQAQSEISAPKSEIPTTEVHVLQGEVSVQLAFIAQGSESRIPNPESQILKAGEAVVSEPDGVMPRVIKAEPSKFVREFPAEESVASAPPLTAGDILAVCRSTLKLVKIDPKTGEQKELAQGDRVRHGRDWMCVAVDQKHQIYIGTEANRAVGGGQVLRIDPRDGAIAVVAGEGLMQGGRISSLAVAADGSLLATQEFATDRILSIHPVSGEATQLAVFGDNASSIALDFNGRDAFVVSDGGPTALARLHGGTLTPWLSYKDPRNYRGVAVSEDGRVFVSSIHLEDRKIMEVDRRTHELRPIVTLPAANAPLGQMAVEADGNLVVGSYGLKGEVFRIDVANKTAKRLAEDGQLQASGGVAVVPSR